MGWLLWSSSLYNQISEGALSILTQYTTASPLGAKCYLFRQDLTGYFPNTFRPDLQPAGTGHLFLDQVNCHRAGKRQYVRNLPGQAQVDAGFVNGAQ